MSQHATSEDCPCCHERMAPGLDTDRALVIAFVAGVMARDTNTPMAEALCSKHSALAADGLGFTLERLRSVKS